MKNTMRQAISALALSAMALGAFAPTALAIETGQLLDHGPKWPHKGYRQIGSAECPGPACTPEVINEAVQRGQITPKDAKVLRKRQSDPKANRGSGGNPPEATKSALCGLPYTPPCRADSPSTERNKSDTIKPTPPSAARSNGGGGNTLAIGGGLAAILGVALAVGSGNSKPSSP